MMTVTLLAVASMGTTTSDGQRRVSVQSGEVDSSAAAGDLEAVAGLLDAGGCPVRILEAEPVAVAAPR